MENALNFYLIFKKNYDIHFITNFFNLELNKLPNGHLDLLYSQNEELSRYKPVFDRIRALQPYQLSDELEKFLHELGIVGDAGKTFR